MAEYETSYDKICKQDLGLVMFPGHWNITQAITLCKNVRGEINVIKDAKNNKQVKELAEKSDICKRGPSEGNTINYYSCYILITIYNFLYLTPLKDLLGLVGGINPRREKWYQFLHLNL